MALGSVVEGLASIIVVWRFTGARTMPESAERRAQRGGAVSFWLLAPYIAIQAVRDLTGEHQAAATVLGIAVTASSVVIRPALGMTKQRLGRRLSSGATAGEGTQDLMCAAQAAAVPFGEGRPGGRFRRWSRSAACQRLSFTSAAYRSRYKGQPCGPSTPLVTASDPGPCRSMCRCSSSTRVRAGDSA